MNELTTTLENIYGIDLSFDALRIKDLPADPTDFQYVSGVQCLAQELQRLFDLTPLGSCIDDPTYGIDWDFIGTPNDPRITVGLAKVAILRGLQHPSFDGRLKVRSLSVEFSPSEPNALRVSGVLDCYGFESVQLARFNAYVIRSGL